VLGFSRDGAYQRTVAPFPANLKPEQVREFGAFDLDGRQAAVRRPRPPQGNSSAGRFVTGGEIFSSLWVDTAPAAGIMPPSSQAKMGCQAP